MVVFSVAMMSRATSKEHAVPAAREGVKGEEVADG